LWVAVNEGDFELAIQAALRSTGHSESFVWSDETTGRIWDRFEASSDTQAMIDCKREALHLQRYGHCAFVIPRVIRIRAAQVAQRPTELAPPSLASSALYHHWLEDYNRTLALEMSEGNRAVIRAAIRSSQ
jgi:hypothetical protein